MARDYCIRFGKGSIIAKGIVIVKTLLRLITFYIIPKNILFLYCIQNIDRIRVKLNNLKNILI